MSMDQVHFSENRDQIYRVMRRWQKIGKSNGQSAMTPRAQLDLMMDLAAADGVNGNFSIDWIGLLGADEFNFIHDISGISNLLNRETGFLDRHFIPRFARTEVA